MTTKWTVVWYRTGGELCEDRYECQAEFDYQECDTEDEVIECIAQLEYEQHPAINKTEWGKRREDFQWLVFDGAPLQGGLTTETLNIEHVLWYAEEQAKKRVDKFKAEQVAKLQQEEERLQKEKERKERQQAERQERRERTSLRNLLAKYGVPGDYIPD